MQGDPILIDQSGATELVEVFKDNGSMMVNVGISILKDHPPNTFNV